MQLRKSSRHDPSPRLATVLLPLLLLVNARGQEIRLDGDHAPADRGHVLLLSETADVEAGKAEVVELRFRVDPGFHINSHAPKDDLLIPTVLRLETAKGVDVLDEVYPKGAAFQLAAGSEKGETLDVYQGEFRVSVRLMVPKGQSTLLGSLRYQACDNAACFPAKTLPLRIMLTGR